MSTPHHAYPLPLPVPVLGHDRRALRVVLLLSGVVLMSLADLYMTLLHLTSVGMMEGNPLARSIMAYRSPGALIAWKLATVALGVGILYWTRRRRAGELGAWACFAMLTALMLQWIHYSHHAPGLMADFEVLATARDPRWVTLAPGGG